jgi:glycerol-3-phosphate dehydrogenase
MYQRIEILSGRNVHIGSYMGSKLQNYYQISTKYFASTQLSSLCSTKLHVSVSKNHRQTKYEEFIHASIYENLYEEVGVKKLYKELSKRNVYNQLSMKNLYQQIDIENLYKRVGT